MPSMTAPSPGPLDEALAKVGDRWTLLIVDALRPGPLRFNELAEAVAGIAPNTLSSRLKHLESAGIVVGRLYTDRPPRSEYHLTAAGAELAGVLRLLAAWGANQSPTADAPRHELCGSAMEARWFCPTCDRVVADADAGELDYA